MRLLLRSTFVTEAKIDTMKGSDQVKKRRGSIADGIGDFFETISHDDCLATMFCNK